MEFTTDEATLLNNITATSKINGGVYHTYILPTICFIVFIINLVAIILLFLRKTVTRHHVVIYLLGLLSSLAIKYLFLFNRFVYESHNRPEGTNLLSIICNIFNYVTYTSYRSYIVILILALLDRLVQSLGNRNNIPSSSLLRFSRKVCNHRVARVCVCVSYALCACACWEYLTVDHSTLVNPGDVISSCDVVWILIWSQLLEFLLQFFFVITFIASLVVFCCSGKHYVQVETVDVGDEKLQSVARINEDLKAMKLILILAVLHLFFNTYFTINEIFPWNDAAEGQFGILSMIEFTNLLYAVCAPLLCLLYWPRLNKNT